MANQDEMNIQIKGEKATDCILSHLIEIETHVVFNTAQTKLIWSRLMIEKDPDFDFEAYSKSVDEELRRIRLEIAATIIKRYS